MSDKLKLVEESLNDFFGKRNTLADGTVSIPMCERYYNAHGRHIQSSEFEIHLAPRQDAIMIVHGGPVVHVFLKWPHAWEHSKELMALVFRKFHGPKGLHRPTGLISAVLVRQHKDAEKNFELRSLGSSQRLSPIS